MINMESTPMYRYVYLALCLWLGCIFSTVAMGTDTFSLDRSFGDNGRVHETMGGVANRGTSVIHQPDGKIIAAGSQSSHADFDFSLIRLLPDGTYDPTFNVDGRVVTQIGRADDEVLAVGLLQDQRIIAAGYTQSEGDRDFALACYLDDGTIDRNFGDEGIVVLQIGDRNDEVTALHVTEDNQILIAGVAEGTSGRVIVAARFDDDGTLDELRG